MKINNEMIMPKNAMALNEEEMRSVEGGVSVNRAQISNFFKQHGKKLSPGGILTYVASVIIMANATNGYTRTIRKGSQGTFTITYKPKASDIAFARALCRMIDITSWVRF